MADAYTVALVGFSENETTTFKSFFRRTSQRPPAYRVQDEVLDAQVLLVNADNFQALALVREARLPGRVLLLGSHDGSTGWLLLRTPMRFASLLRSLDVLVGQRTVEAGSDEQAFINTQAFEPSQLRGLHASTQLNAKSTAHPTPDCSCGTEFSPTRPMDSADTLTAGGASRNSLMPSSAPRARSTRSPKVTRFGRGEPLVPETLRGDALLVCQSLIEGRILLKRFLNHELVIDWCREPSQSQVMMKAHAYRLVIIDRLNGDLDEFQICRLAKQANGPDGTPKVILFAPTGSGIDRMKASLAGADAFLSRSVSEADLYKVLDQHSLVNRDGSASTSFGGF